MLFGRPCPRAVCCCMPCPCSSMLCMCCACAVSVMLMSSHSSSRAVGSRRVKPVHSITEIGISKKSARAHGCGHVTRAWGWGRRWRARVVPACTAATHRCVAPCHLVAHHVSYHAHLSSTVVNSPSPSSCARAAVVSCAVLRVCCGCVAGVLRVCEHVAINEAIA